MKGKRTALTEALKDMGFSQHKAEHFIGMVDDLKMPSDDYESEDTDESFFTDLLVSLKTELDDE